ncbi:unnamed protein product [Vitrella brassicaformis CCMP3155]|uniref:EF-hand domain-containing protein n=3 Tax=Vitrella brassicaformis TaxID=1169539 RepID=A0A0G4G7N2_VITBC|nr:unnamed protein product [Vitrella brassicaformis CCMP3155]|eukprot:CEM24709.1 unnamed protein product [Vitrella brassicaformis CCMP3155]
MENLLLRGKTLLTAFDDLCRALSKAERNEDDETRVSQLDPQEIHFYRVVDDATHRVALLINSSRFSDAMNSLRAAEEALAAWKRSYQHSSVMPLEFTRCQLVLLNAFAAYHRGLNNHHSALSYLQKASLLEKLLHDAAVNRHYQWAETKNEEGPRKPHEQADKIIVTPDRDARDSWSGVCLLLAHTRTNLSAVLSQMKRHAEALHHAVKALAHLEASLKAPDLMEEMNEDTTDPRSYMLDQFANRQLRRDWCRSVVASFRVMGGELEFLLDTASAAYIYEMAVVFVRCHIPGDDLEGLLQDDLMQLTKRGTPSRARSEAADESMHVASASADGGDDEPFKDIAKLRQACCDIHESMIDKYGSLAAAFKHADGDSDGIINSDDFLALLTNLQLRLSVSLGFRVFELLDQYPFGFVREREFVDFYNSLACWLPHHKRPSRHADEDLQALDEDSQTLERFRRRVIRRFRDPNVAFRLIDEDNDGRIDQADLVAWCPAMFDMIPEDAEKLFEELDRDRCESVTCAEFEAFFALAAERSRFLPKLTPEDAKSLRELKHMIELRFGSIAAAFARLDVDGTQLIRIGEFLRATKRWGIERSDAAWLFHLLDWNDNG